MAKINIEVDDKNLPIVLNILENLKIGLIKDISVEKLQKIAKPISSSISNQSNRKYLSKDKYKQKVNQRPQEDEFLSKAPSSGKYISKEAFKNKLKKGN